MSSLRIIVDSDKDLAVMNLRGRISIETSPDLRIRLLAILRTLNPSAVIDIDLTDVSYLDTSGLGTLTEGLKIAAGWRDCHAPPGTPRPDGQSRDSLSVPEKAFAHPMRRQSMAIRARR